MNKSILSTEVKANRKADYEVNPVFLNRWSPRSFQDKAVSDEVLFSLFEAARWAPSGSNTQPWRFILARSKVERRRFNSFINDGNREWCERAPVLTLAFSHKLTPSGNHNRSHAFDTGAAWGYLALQASILGLITHAMGGFDREKAREALQIPEDYELHAVIAIGYRGEPAQLSEARQEQEKPSTRKPVNEFIFAGNFNTGLEVE